MTRSLHTSRRAILEKLNRTDLVRVPLHPIRRPTIHHPSSITRSGRAARALFLTMLAGSILFIAWFLSILL